MLDGPKQDIQMVMACLLSGEGGIFLSAACTYLSWNEARELLKPPRMSTPGTRRTEIPPAVLISVEGNSTSRAKVLFMAESPVQCFSMHLEGVQGDS